MKKKEHRINNGIEEKHCFKCDTWKPLGSFGIGSKVWDGLRADCKECATRASKQYYQNNPEKRKEMRRRYRQNNPEKYRQNRKKARMRRQLNPKNKLYDLVSHAIYRSLCSNKDGRYWGDLVGYSIKKLIQHLEKQFQPGMTWDNYGEWHVDHKVPVSAFNFRGPGDIDFKRCWALSNLQPLWAKDNVRKGAKLDKCFQPSLAL